MKRALITTTILTCSATGFVSAQKATEHSQAGWRLKSDAVSLFVTETGGHMAPVKFYANSNNPIEPYYISPWQDEKHDSMPAEVMVPLRGDFFCMPFGGNGEEVNGEKHTPHGEVSASKWSFAGSGKKGKVSSIKLTMKTKTRSGNATKELRLLEGHNIIYSTHTLAGYSGKMPLGHHATLALPEEEGSVRIATSKFEVGFTNPTQFSNPVNREYQSLAMNARFTDLTKVPLIWKGAADADCTSFPQRTGHTDLLQICKKPGDEPAWLAATCESRGYLWFSMKDPSILNSTVFWIANKGRHAQPWNGRNRCLGLEDVCGYFADGLAPSLKPNLVNKAGFATAVELSPDKPTAINYIQGVAKIPRGFTNVKTVRFGDDKVTFTSVEGKVVEVAVQHRFLKTGRLE